jgi:hypothetical protein
MADGGYIAQVDGYVNQHAFHASVAPNYQFAAEHIRLLTGSTGTPMCFRVLAKNGHARNLNGTLAQLWHELSTLNHPANGWQLYVVVNEGGHDSASITGVRSLFVDADGKPMPERWHTEPDFIVHRDATHWHAYWRVCDFPNTHPDVVGIGRTLSRGLR